MKSLLHLAVVFDAVMKDTEILTKIVDHIPMNLVPKLESLNYR